MDTDAGFDALLTALYSAVSDPRLLQDFVAHLGSATNCHVGTLLRQDVVHQSGNLGLVTGADADLIARYPEYADDNLWIERTKDKLSVGCTLFSHDWVQTREIKRTRYYADILGQNDIEFSLGICAQLDRSRVTFLSLCRSERQGEFTGAERALVQRIAPHVVNAFALLTRLEVMGRQVDAAMRTRHGVLWLDADFRWMGGNDAAECMLSAGWWKSRHGLPLEPCHAVTRSFWRSAQQSFASGQMTMARVFPVCSADGKLVAFARLHAFGASLAERRSLPSYALFVCPIHGHDHAGLVSHLKSLFGLTVAEATLVAVLRGTGDLEAAAQRIGIGKASARTRLQSVFDKTDLHTQIDLIRMADALAEACS